MKSLEELVMNYAAPLNTTGMGDVNINSEPIGVNNFIFKKKGNKKRMKHLKQYINETFGEKFINHIRSFEKFINDINNILSNKKLTHNDYLSIKKLWLQHLDYCLKEKLGYSVLISSKYNSERNSTGVQSLDEVNNRLIVTIYNNKTNHGATSVGPIYYEDFIKKDKYIVGATYSPNETVNEWEVNVEESIREYLTLYIKDLQPSLDYWNKYKKVNKTKTKINDDPNDIF